MRRGAKRNVMPDDLTTAIGLVWGRLRAFQFDEADQLARGCLRIWPEDKSLMMLGAYAAVELACPLDEPTLAFLRDAGCPEWSELLLSRAQSSGGGEKLQ